MRRKFYSLRGGYRVNPNSIKSMPVLRPIAPTRPAALDFAYKAYKSPMGQKLAGFAKAYAMNKLDRIIKDASGSSVTAFAPRGSVSKSINTPSVYGAFGSVTRTNYISGKRRISKRTREQGKLVNIANTALNVNISTSFQGVGQTSYLNSAVLSETAKFYSGKYDKMIGQNGSTRYFVAGVSAEWKITNSSNVGCTVEIYEVEPRDTIQGSTISQVNGNPTNAWNWPLANLQSPVGTVGYAGIATAATTYGSSPFDSETFVQFYSIKKKFKIELPASTTHVHESTYNVCREFDLANVTDSNINHSIKHFTKWVMIVVRGNPVHASANSDLVGPSGMSLDITVSTRTETYGIIGSSTVASISSGFEVPPSPVVYTTPTTEQPVSTD